MERMGPQLLLSYDFPPMGGGIARLMGELAKRYPPGRLIVSTGQFGEGDLGDQHFVSCIDRLPVRSSRPPQRAGTRALVTTRWGISEKTPGRSSSGVVT